MGFENLELKFKIVISSVVSMTRRRLEFYILSFTLEMVAESARLMVKLKLDRLGYRRA